MKITASHAVLGSAIALLSTQASATHGHAHAHGHYDLHKKHVHEHLDAREAEPNDTDKAPADLRRDLTCQFPTDKGAVAVTPGMMNGGWAMAPDKTCHTDKWCPIACPAGMVMNQWKPGTTYKYPESTYGGIYCDENGQLQEGFPGQPWCVQGTGAVEAVNEAGSVVSFCQTILPGDEDMLAVTEVHDRATLAVPSIDYWDKTSAHFYVNSPGIAGVDACLWGSITQAKGNWSPYVAGANTDANGNTFVKLGFNPEWTGCGLSSQKPTFALEIKCPDGWCNGLPCAINPDGINGQGGASGSDFCVVTVPKGGKAEIVITNLDGPNYPVQPPPSPSPAPSPPPTPTPKTSSSAQLTTSASSTEEVSSVSTFSSVTTSSTMSFGYAGIFQENITSSSQSDVGPSTTSFYPTAQLSTAAPTETKSSDGPTNPQANGAVAGLIVAMVAAGVLL